MTSNTSLTRIARHQYQQNNTEDNEEDYHFVMHGFAHSKPTAWSNSFVLWRLQCSIQQRSDCGDRYSDVFD